MRCSAGWIGLRRRALGAMKISKNTILKINNIVLYLAFSFLVGSGLIMLYRIPPCSRGDDTGTVLGMGRHDWGELHWWVGLFMVAMMLVHLVVNRAWLTKIAAKGGSWKLWGGLALGLLMVGGLFAMPIQEGGGGCDGCSSSEDCGGGGGGKGKGGCKSGGGCEKEGCGAGEDEGCGEKGSEGCAKEDPGGGGCEGCEEKKKPAEQDCEGCDG